MGFLSSLFGESDSIESEIAKYDGTNIFALAEIVVYQFTDNRRYIQLAKNEIKIPDDSLHWFVLSCQIFMITAPMEAARQKFGNKNYQVLLNLFLLMVYSHYKKHNYREYQKPDRTIQIQ